MDDDFFQTVDKILDHCLYAAVGVLAGLAIIGAITVCELFRDLFL